jgi:hypothetical protein
MTPYKKGNLLTRCATIAFSRRILLRHNSTQRRVANAAPKQNRSPDFLKAETTECTKIQQETKPLETEVSNVKSKF